MPSASGFLDRNAAGLGFDADQMSMSGASSFSESQLSSTSGSQSSSGFSQTSKLSKRNPDRKQKKKMRKRRQVKEGSPFEEDNLIEILKEEVRCTAEEKDQTKAIMNALVFFGEIETATKLHGLTERVMRAEHVCQSGLWSVEQQSVMKNQPDLAEYYFADQLGSAKIDEAF